MTVAAGKPRFDLLLQGGRVIDPSQGIDATLDVAIEGDRIRRVAPGIDPGLAREVRDVRGRLVTPGLIDLHVHVFQHLVDAGLPVDDAGVNAGVTTVVDQGSAGAWTLDAFKAFVADTAVTETLVFLSVNLTGTLRGCKGGPIVQNPDYMDRGVTLKFIRRFPQLIRGVKGHGESGSWSRWGDVMLREARETADEAGLPLYIHTGELWQVDERNRPQPETVLPGVLKYARPGDLIAHCYSCRDDGILGQRERPIPELLECVANGVHLDLGHGINFSFETARRMMAAGLYPYTLGTDVHGDFGSNNNDTTLDYSLVGSMSKLMALGFDLGFVVRAATAHPAAVLRMADEIGTLREGSRADVTVLDLVEAPWTFHDCNGESLPAGSRLVPRLVVRNGRAIVPTCRLLRDVMPVREPSLV